MDDRDTQLVEFFNNVEKKDNSILRIFAKPGANVIGYYVLGQYVSMVAQQYIRSTCVVKQWGTASNPVPMVPINEATMRDLVRDGLLQLGISVELYERNSASGQWKCVSKGSPGHIGDFEGILFDSADVDVQMTQIAAVQIKADTGNVFVGVAFINSTMRTISVVEFHDNTQLVHLDSLISQFSLKEILFPATLAEHYPLLDASVKRIVERAANVMCRPIPSKSFNAGDVSRKLMDVLRVHEATIEIDGMKLAVEALGALLLHQDLGSDVANKKSFSLKLIHTNSFMKLDMAAIRALNIVAVGQPESGKGKLPISIFGFFNRCLTGMGSRLMRQWFLQPLQSVNDINDRLNAVELMVESPAVRDSLKHDVFKHCADMDRMNKKLQRGSSTLKDLTLLLSFCEALENVSRILEYYKGRHAKFLQDEYIAPLQEILGYLSNLKTLIETSVEVVEREPRIKPEFDDELIELDEQLVALEKAISKEYSIVMKKYKWNEKQLKAEYHSTYGHVFRVARKDDKQVRENSELISLNTAKDGVRFSTPDLSAANDTHRRVTKAYDARQASLCKKLMETVSTYLPLLDDSKEIVARLDVFAAWATVVSESKSPIVRPEILPSEEGKIHISNARHPLVEIRQTFVPNSIAATKDQNAFLITGPNMGGKSTYMRSVGVSVILAQVGCFVPADMAEISIHDSILCRVGASDHMSYGVSTFMLEMLESSSILSAATSKSLVIIDELGRGTSTYDGFGLAWAIAESLACESKATLLFATHFHELTQLADEHPNIANVHVGAQTEGVDIIKFLFKVEPGPCNRSFGIHVAQMAKLPQQVLDDAKAKGAELETFMKGNSNNIPKISAKVVESLSVYAKRISELGLNPSQEEINKLRSSIANDAEVSALLKQ